MSETNPTTPKTPKTPFYYKVSQFGLRLSFRFFFRIKYYGLEHVPLTGGAIIASNHESYFDPCLVGCNLKRHAYFMARETLFKNRFFAWLIRKHFAFPVRRGGLGLDALRNSVEILQNGNLVVMFPEGTRSEDGVIHNLNPGVALAAQKAGVPIIPAVVEGAYKAWPKNKKIFRFSPIRVIFGPLLPTPGPGKEEQRQAVEILHQRLLDLQAKLKELP